MLLGGGATLEARFRMQGWADIMREIFRLHIVASRSPSGTQKTHENLLEKLREVMREILHESFVIFFVKF